MVKHRYDVVLHIDVTCFRIIFPGKIAIWFLGQAPYIALASLRFGLEAPTSNWFGIFGTSNTL